MTSINYFLYNLNRGILRTSKYEKFVHSFFIKQSFRKKICTSSKSVRYSQPSSITHPHLLKKGEITPGLSTDLYKRRRQKMVEMIYRNSPTTSSENKSSHLIALPSNSTVYMSENIPYPFRQNSDFLYLCGFKEPNCVLILHSLANRPDSEYQSTLFIPRQSSHSIKWEGLKMDLHTVTNFLGVDEALYMDDFENFLESFAKSHKRFTVWYDYLSTPFRQVGDVMRSFLTEYSGNISVESPKMVLHQMRLIKSDVEVELMRKTCKIAAESMKDVIKFSYAMVPESHLQAKMDYECRIQGADYLAFPPVVAGGDRANTIHYIDNNNIINDNEMVLMDAGCECHGYSSDMTRTWPVSGKFTSAQRELYEMVLLVQEELIQMCETKIPLDQLFNIMCIKLGKGLQELGVISSSIPEGGLADAAYSLCPHHVSHYLGMDVHDTNLISRNIRLQPGMVVTIEPGIYISGNYKCPEKYRGLCIRIEDDILITNDGYEVLTSACPKQVNQIEELCRKC